MTVNKTLCNFLDHAVDIGIIKYVQFDVMVKLEKW